MEESNYDTTAVIPWLLFLKHKHPKACAAPNNVNNCKGFSHSSGLIFQTWLSLQMSHSNRSINAFDMCQHYPEEKMLDCFTGTHSTKKTDNARVCLGLTLPGHI